MRIQWARRALYLRGFAYSRVFHTSPQTHSSQPRPPRVSTIRPFILSRPNPTRATETFGFQRVASLCEASLQASLAQPEDYHRSGFFSRQWLDGLVFVTSLHLRNPEEVDLSARRRSLRYFASFRFSRFQESFLLSRRHEAR